MQNYEFDTVVIGGGAAGMAAALEIEEQGFKVAIIEREEVLGGILLQCIHNGFGLHEFKTELTGPEYAGRFSDLVENKNIEVFLNSIVAEISQEENNKRDIYCYSGTHGVFSITTKTVVMAMGCRERNRGSISIPGTRPAGVYTAGLAQRLVNVEGYIPGKDVVIIGSGDIGLIMARRMSWSGAKVHAVIEILPYPSGLTRNIVQCLNDFDIPLHLSHVVTKIYGKDRVEKVDVTPLIEGRPDYDKTFSIKCDTLLLSVGLIPENELLRSIDIEINQLTNGPIVNSRMMTSEEGIFACGNMLHVHDLVDYATEESKRTGNYVVNYLNSLEKNEKNEIEYRVKTGSNVRYIVPNMFNPNKSNKFYLRSMIVKDRAELEIKLNDTVIKKIRKKHIQPSEMITFSLPAKIFEEYNLTSDSTLTVSLRGLE